VFAPAGQMRRPGRCAGNGNQVSGRHCDTHDTHDIRDTHDTHDMHDSNAREAGTPL